MNFRTKLPVNLLRFFRKVKNNNIYISNILLLLVTVFFVDNLGVFINNYLILFQKYTLNRTKNLWINM